jgi:hypothetical protein
MSHKHYNHKLQISYWENGELFYEEFEGPTQDDVYHRLEHYSRQYDRYTFKVYNHEGHLLESKHVEVDTYA